MYVFLPWDFPLFLGYNACFQFIIFFGTKNVQTHIVNYFPISHLLTVSFSLLDLMLEDRILFMTVSSNSHGWDSSSLSLVCEEIAHIGWSNKYKYFKNILMPSLYFKFYTCFALLLRQRLMSWNWSSNDFYSSVEKANDFW